LLSNGHSILEGYRCVQGPSYVQAFLPEDPLTSLAAAQIDKLQSLWKGMSLVDTAADLGNYFDSLVNDWDITPDQIDKYLRETLNTVTDETMANEGFLSPQQFRERYGL